MTISGKPLAGVCVSTAIFVCGAAGFPVAPEIQPPSTGVLVLDTTADSPLELAPGGDVRLIGDGFADYANVSVVVYSTPTEVAQVISDGEGAIDVTVNLPTDLVGDHTVTANGNGPDGEPVSLQAHIAVQAATTADTGSITTIPRTGASLALTALGGLGMILAGFVLIRTAVFGRKFMPV